MKAELKQRVARRAGWRCEYCRMPQQQTSLPFHIDHVIAQQHRGRTRFENQWHVHFRLDGYRVVGVTASGRATVEVLAINHPVAFAMRAHLMKEGLF